MFEYKSVFGILDTGKWMPGESNYKKSRSDGHSPADDFAGSALPFIKKLPGFSCKGLAIFAFNKVRHIFNYFILFL